VDLSKVEGIQTWPIPKSITEVRSFYGLTAFYRRLIKDFSSLMAPIAFEWTKATQKAFEDVKQKLCQAPVLALPNFKDLFKVEYDASGVGLGLFQSNQRGLLLILVRNSMALSVL